MTIYKIPKGVEVYRYSIAKYGFLDNIYRTDSDWYVRGKNIRTANPNYQDKIDIFDDREWLFTCYNCIESVKLNIIVIAGTHAEYNQYINTHKDDDIIYIEADWRLSYKLRGCHANAVIYYGTYFNIPNLQELKQLVQICLI